VSKPANNTIISTNLRDHPAVRVWGQLRPGQVEPAAIEILREGKGSGIYRLEGVGLDGSAIIAKRCRQADALIEQTIYEEVLPRLPITVIRYYGCVMEPDNEFGWLFLEDAGKQKYSPFLEEHRALAAQWLGRLHTSAAHVAIAEHLPNRGPRHYLEHLRSGRDKIMCGLANTELTADDLVLLKKIVAQFEFLEACWSQVERFCETLPWTLVHGDFTGKNLCIRSGQAGIALLPFDWEDSGWGVPATDLAQSALLGSGGFSANPNITTYYSVVHNHWPNLDLPMLQRLACCGKVFRCLAAVNWKAQRLAYQGAEWVVSEMRIYQAELADAIQAAPWA
jgi:hypothetical protein